MNILIAANSNFIGPTSVMVYSLCRSHENIKVDIYLAYHDLRGEDIERLKKITSCFPDKELHLLDVGGEFASKVTATERFSHETYYRILAVNMLPYDMERILYLDADMLVKKNLTEVYETPMGETCPFVVCADMMGPTRGGTNRGVIPDDCLYFNAGFMLINLEYLRRRNSLGYILDAFYREQNRYPYPDQDVLNHMYYDKVRFAP